MRFSPALHLVFALIVTGCASQPSRCYVTLTDEGRPSAEACETGSNLRVRPITAENAAFYAPPYVLAALANEGYLSMSAADAADELPMAMQRDEPVFAVDDEAFIDRAVGDRIPIFSLSVPALLLSIELSLPRNEAASQALPEPNS